jgi:hypothetical protein
MHVGSGTRTPHTKAEASHGGKASDQRCLSLCLPACMECRLLFIVTRDAFDIGAQALEGLCLLAQSDLSVLCGSGMHEPY